MSIPNPSDSVHELALMCVRCAVNMEVERISGSTRPIWEDVCPNCGCQVQAWPVQP